MNYLISKFPCIVSGKDKYNVLPYCKYQIDLSTSNLALITPCDLGISYAVDFYCLCNGVQKSDYVDIFELNNNRYFILKACKVSCSTFVLKHKNKDVLINCGTGQIVIDGQVVGAIDKESFTLENVEYENNFLYVYLAGSRNYIVIIENGELKCASYYDEINIEDNQKYFMCRLYDGINHGMVHCVCDGKYNNYLVYLDEAELKLKAQFLPHIFLDCVKAKNVNYANALLSNNIKCNDKEDILQFFPIFDDYVALSEVEFVLYKKDTQMGIYKFILVGDKIDNIISY